MAATKDSPGWGRVVTWMSRHVTRTLAALDLTPQAYTLLAILEEHPKTATDLSEILGLSRPRVTSLVDEMSARGLVRRDLDVADKRRVLHYLSESGAALLEQADTSVNSTFTCLAAPLTARERQAADAGLRVWSGQLAAWRDRRRSELGL